MDKEKLKVIDGEYTEWVSVHEIYLDADIADTVQVINCDTRDFAIGWLFERPSIHEKAEFNCKSLYSLIKKKNREKFSINKKDILTWLDSLCKATGGYNLDWRCVKANIKDCRWWNLKYIRFVRNEKSPVEFIVCNAYMQPIEYRKIIDNLEKNMISCRLDHVKRLTSFNTKNLHK